MCMCRFRCCSYEAARGATFLTSTEIMQCEGGVVGK
jgi:hypothetical protein